MQPDLMELASRHGLRRSGTRYVGPCPKCGGSADSHRFVLFADGGYKCFAGCGFSGDRVRWLREMEGMGCKAAHQAAGKDCSVACPQYMACYGGGERVERRVTRLQPKRRPRERSRSITIRDQPPPSERWTAWATQHVAACHKRLLTKPGELAWLAQRGIDLGAVQLFGLGWQEHDEKIPWDRLGIDASQEEKPALWVPGGLVIPIWHMGGAICRIRHRRPPEARARFGEKLKYVQIKGSGTAPMTINIRAGKKILVVVESELDGIAVAAACPEVGVIALGTVAQPLTPALDAVCRGAKRILVALDADEMNEHGRRPGPEAATIWRLQYRGAVYSPVPEGKDVGDYASLGGDLRTWIAALAPEIRNSDSVEKRTTARVPVDTGEEDEGLPWKIEALAWLLDGEQGHLLVAGAGVRVRYRDGRGSTNQNRAQVYAFVYGDVEVKSMLARLAQGVYGPGLLRQSFSGGGHAG